MEWGENVKKRRLQQIQSIRHGQMMNHDLHFPKEWAASDDATLWKQKNTTPGSSKWLRKLMLQSIFAVMLLAVTYVSLQTQSVPGRQVKDFITEAMNRPFNFQGMTAWYQSHMGTTPTILPTFQAKTPTKPIWQSPVAGIIVLPFNQERNGLVLRTQKKATVVAPAEGVVTFVGPKEGMGQTVIIQHADSKETWISLLDSTSVKQKQWVKTGEVLGRAGEEKGQSLVYVALKKGENFVNPTEVIPFD